MTSVPSGVSTAINAWIMPSAPPATQPTRRKDAWTTSAAPGVKQPFLDLLAAVKAA